MELTVYGRNVKVPERMREYVEEKVEKFEKLNDRVESIDVKVAKVGSGPQSITVEITVHGPGPVLRATDAGRPVTNQLILELASGLKQSAVMPS